MASFKNALVSARDYWVLHPIMTTCLAVVKTLSSKLRTCVRDKD